MKHYNVDIFEKPYSYCVEANNKAEAEVKACKIHTADESNIGKVEVTRVSKRDCGCMKD